MLKMNQKGFSLMELMVVIFIVGLASSIVIAQYSNSRNSKALSLGLKQVANDIRMAQNYSFGALETGGENPSGGYGIRFSKNSNSYVIFGDENSNKTYDGVGEDFQTINLPEGVKVTSLTVEESIKNNVDVVFTSPYGKIYIDKDYKDANDNFIDLEIKISNSAGTETINLRSSGQIN